ncbi:hypothetical protein ETB97_005949 [Aspergillus alliaceus]|uniref:DUF7082 domain-containing protein n=1 Tax=Petromyces alliaceus TaxID=209559 RepID=A0A8H5ZXZ4_PETAA|nr:hypothetical protein ETB97_005949 [Aspergillus burnettii]
MGSAFTAQWDTMLNRDDGNCTWPRPLREPEFSQPEIISFFPDRGPQETLVFVGIRSTSMLVSDNTSFNLIFGSLWSNCTLTYLGFDANGHYYVLGANAPTIDITQYITLCVPLWLRLPGPLENTSSALYVGVFSYGGQTALSLSSEYGTQPGQDLICRASADAQQLLGETPFEPLTIDVESCIFGRPAALVTTINPLAYQVGTVDGHTTDTAPHHSQIGIAGELEDDALNASGDAIDAMASCPAVSMDTHTSATIDTHSAASVLRGGYIIPIMAVGWTKEETAGRRRIVRFLSLDRGIDHIHICMLPVAVYQDMPGSVCVSCIYWPALDECFITSADVLHLLQYFLQRNIPHPERSRIRQILARFLPRLISRFDTESCQFARMVRGFKNPRALAIRKDAKIFRWRDLELALITVLNRYAVEARFSVCMGDA